MAIARSTINGPPPPVNMALAEFYRNGVRELRERAVQRLVKDTRKLSPTARHARALMREVAEILQDLDEEAAEWIAKEIPKAYLRGVRTADLSFGEIGLSTQPGLRPLVHREAIEVLVNDLQDDLGEVPIRIGKNYRTLTRRTQLQAAQDKAITETTARGILEGKQRREVSREIRMKLIDDLGDAPLVINGRSYDVGKYAEMVARTKTAEAQTAGTVNRVIDAGHDLVMVTAHGADDGCSYYEGKVFSISGTSEKYPALDSLPNGGPPFHPNCRHGLAPFVDDLASGAEKRRAKGVSDAVLGKPYGEVEKLYKNKRRT